MNGNEKKNTGSGFEKVTRERIDNLKETFDKFVKNDFHTLQMVVENIRDKLLDRIPWPITTFITVVSSLCAALVIFALMK